MNRHTEQDFVFNSSVSLDLLDDDKWDSRNHVDKQVEEKHIGALANDIGQNGLINPITIIPNNTKHRYSIIAGRFRVLACKKLGWSTVPAKIIIDPQVLTDENRLNAISFSENEVRMGYSEDERIARMLRPFHHCGFSNQDIIYFAKKIHNDGTKNIPDKFLDCIEELDLSPNYLYQVMQTFLQVDPKVQAEFTKQNLKLHKRVLLTHSKLKEHPKVAISLVKRIKGMSFKKSSFEVRQAIRDLETGATIKAAGGYVFDYTKREDVSKVTDELIERTNQEHYIELMRLIERVLFHSTGYKLNGQARYEPNNVDYTENHRINILKSLTPVQQNNLEQDLDTLKDAVNSWLELMDTNPVQATGRGEITN